MHLSTALNSAILLSALPHAIGYDVGKPAKIRTVVTTDMESDDVASLVRYLLYTNDLENQGLVYTSSKFHWEGDGKGTEFFLPDREYNTSQTSWRPVGTTTLEDEVLKAYAEVYPNLRQHDPSYPTPAKLLSITKVGNVDFEGEMSKDTDGSNLIKKLLLDNDARPLYLQAWGGTNTIARALKSIEDEYSTSRQWPSMKRSISKKAVVLASGFQDETYANYIAPTWPMLRVEEYSAAWDVWGFNCNKGQGNIRGLPDYNQYFKGAWIKAHIQIGPLGSLYRSWLDGQTTAGGGDQLDVFGDPAKANSSWCKPMEKYDFLSEGDDVVFLPLIPTGLEQPDDPTLGNWIGRLTRNSTTPDLWALVNPGKNATGSEVARRRQSSWAGAAQNDFAARMKWTLESEYSEGNHPPLVKVANVTAVEAKAGSRIVLSARVSDPDGDQVALSWWQFREEGTYPAAVGITAHDDTHAEVEVPGDAESGQTISIIAEATDDGEFPLTRYDRVMIRVI